MFYSIGRKKSILQFFSLLKNLDMYKTCTVKPEPNAVEPSGETDIVKINLTQGKKNKQKLQLPVHFFMPLVLLSLHSYRNDTM